MLEPKLAWLEDPTVFAVNRLPACSDHEFYQSEPGDLTLNLNGTWKVNVSESPDQRPEGFYKEGYDRSGFADVLVPGELQMQGFLPNHYTNTLYPWDGIEDLKPGEVPASNAVASYFTEFELPENYEDYEQILTFHGAETAIYVWVNGNFIGYAEDSFTPSHFNISQYVCPNRNTLAVEVYQRSSASWLEDQDMWRYMGIFRDVTISMIPKIHVQDLKTIQDIDLAQNSAMLEIVLHNKVEIPGKMTFRLFFDGKKICQMERPAAAEMFLALDVPNVRLWSPEIPNLYTLEIDVEDESGTILEKVRQSIGFRKIEIDERTKSLLLNGKRLVFHGVNRHEFSAETGRSLDKRTMEHDADFMKDFNINAVRTSHYPNDSYWYELCDKKGIALIDEANLETHGTWQKLGACEPSANIPGSLDAWKPAVLDRIMSMYERDKNHPSVLIWSLGNESYGGENFIEAHDWLKQHDASRPVHYEGVSWIPAFEAATDLESHMYAKADEVRKYLENAPQKPYLLCEYAHAMGNSLGNLDEYIELEKYPAYAGGFIWDFVDQAIAKSGKDGKIEYLYGGDFADFPNDGNFCGDGLLFADRSVSPKALEARQQYRYVDIDIDIDNAGVLIKNRYMFQNLEDFVFDYEQKKDGKVISSGSLAVCLEPGKSLFVPIGWVPEDASGTWTKTVIQKTKDGKELAFGQSVIQIPESPDLGEKKNKEFSPELRVVEGDGNCGIYGQNFSAYFQYQKGLVSLKSSGLEMLKQAVGLELCRAFTDNDEGAGYPQQAAVWMMAARYASIKSCQVEKEASSVKVRYRYAIPFVNREADLFYEVFPCGKIGVDLEMDYEPEDPLLPLFGLRFVMPLEFDTLEYLAKGPQDTYIDRQAARLDWYTSSAQAEYVDYLRPQEHGNHTGLLELRALNSQGQGLVYKAENKPLEGSMSFYTCEELQSADHRSELPQPYEVVVRILSEQMGVGGDDTWGAPVHDKYLIQPQRRLSLHFTLSFSDR